MRYALTQICLRRKNFISVIFFISKGVINPATREWKDGLFSTIMRDLSNVQHDGPKWIVLDGDIDPMWIESLNTVMDDNKVISCY